ncbi:DUF333 domain-containing protein [Thiohalocapsa sp. ML1]|uniref:putative hemolysin n=1 Tax=Thiohalocapsa sp. ML1 TaxID=1431688 RepID=UPI0007322625|nr:DUF333 domain-containing protein [Thiohalocapsa sp. ML1]
MRRRHFGGGINHLESHITAKVRLSIIAGAIWVGAGVAAPAGATDAPTGLPNPAAVFCAEQGGEYLRDSDECRLPDGTRVNAWERYRGEHQSTT